MKIIICPKCKKEGRINAFTPKGKKTEYVVVHEMLDYNWGTSKKYSEQVTARRRCYLKKPSHRQQGKDGLNSL